MIRKCFKRASASRSGDYDQVLFEDDEDDPETDYVLLQRQFEFPDGDRIQIETLDMNVCGHFRVRAASLSRTCLRLDVPSAGWMHLEIHYLIDDRAYRDVRRVLRTMLGTRLTLIQ